MILITFKLKFQVDNDSSWEGFARGPRPWPTWPIRKSVTGEEYVLLPCFNAQSDIFAVKNCCVVPLSLFSSDILTWSTDSYIQCNDT